MFLSITLLILVTAQRLAELVYARHNTARLMAKGGREFGSAHYPFIVAVHTFWLAGLWYYGWDEEINWWWLALFVVLQLLRVWVLLTLGERWTTRIIVLPGAPLITSGPFRIFRHPNYAVVVLEIFCLPMVFGLWFYALLFTLINGLVLGWRIRVEEQTIRHWSATPEETYRQD